MVFPHEQPPARPQQTCDNIGPAADTGYPAQRPNTGEGKIKTISAECLHPVIDIGLNESDIGPRAPSQFPSGSQCSRGKIQTHRRSWPQRRQRDRVGADVTLQMQDIEPVEPTQLRQVVCTSPDKNAGCIGPSVQSYARLPIRQI